MTSPTTTGLMNCPWTLSGRLRSGNIPVERLPRRASGKNAPQNSGPARGSVISSRCIGIGGEAYSQNTTGTFIDSASANLMLRLPLNYGGFSPYRPVAAIGWSRSTVWSGGCRHRISSARMWGCFWTRALMWPNKTKIGTSPARSADPTDGRHRQGCRGRIHSGPAAAATSNWPRHCQ